MLSIKFPLILNFITIIIIIIIIIINLPGLNRKNAWLRPRIFCSSKSVYIMHKGYSKNIEQIRFCFPSIERDLFNPILLFYLSVVRKHECKFLKQYQFVFCLFNFPIKRIGTRLQSQIKKQTETCTFDEGGRNSRFEAFVYSGL